MPIERRRILVTRPAAEAAALAARLEALGFAAVVEPMLRIVPTGAPLPLDGVQAVLLTSSNGARALAAATARRDLNILTVGDATMRTAREAGFAAVESAAGDVVALERLVRARCAPDRGALLHVSGRDVAGDLSGALAAAGFVLRRAVLYRAEPAAALSPGLCAAIAQERIDAALFFSPRTAHSFVTLAGAAGLAGACRHVAAFGLSRNVAAALAALEWRGVHVAAEPTQPALLDALAAWAAEVQGDRGKR